MPEKDFYRKQCLLEDSQGEKKAKVKIGDELEIITKEGRKFTGILCAVLEGRIHVVVSLGILMAFPIGSLMNVYHLCSKL